MTKTLLFLSLITQQQKPGLFEALLPIFIIFFIFYFLLIRPQQKRMKAHRKFLESLEKGQEVVTSGGIIGKVVGITERVVTLEIANGVRVKIIKDQIAGPYREKGEKTS